MIPLLVKLNEYRRRAMMFFKILLGIDVAVAVVVLYFF